MAFAAAILTLDRGPRWMPLWVGAIPLLSFTRDSTWIPVLAAGWCAAPLPLARVAVSSLRRESRPRCPALLIFSTPARDPCSQSSSTTRSVPSDTSWAFIASRYPHAAFEVVRANVGFLRRGEWYTAFYLVGGVLALLALARRRRPDDLTPSLLRAGAFLGLGYVFAAPVFSAFRLELVFVPMAAYGLRSPLSSPQRASGRWNGSPCALRRAYGAPDRPAPQTAGHEASSTLG